MAWLVSWFFKVMEACTTYMLYPYVSKWAWGSLGGRSMVSHSLDYFKAIHMLSQLPIRLWTKQMLIVALR